MSRAKNTQSAAAAVARVAAKPYTGRSDRDHDGMTAAGAEALQALDRRMTEGLNLVHGQLAAERQERQEGFRQAHEERNAIREEMHEGFRQAREEREAGFGLARKARETGFQQAQEERNAIRQEMHEGFRQAREERESGFARLERRMAEGFLEFGERFARMEAAILKLTERVSVLEERTVGTRRLVWGVLGGLALLIAGGVLRPLFDRAIAALLAGG